MQKNSLTRMFQASTPWQAERSTNGSEMPEIDLGEDGAPNQQRRVRVPVPARIECGVDQPPDA